MAGDKYVPDFISTSDWPSASPDLNFLDYKLWSKLSAVSVVIVIIAICDIPRQEFSLRERVYIYITYMKSRKSCSETRRKFPESFQDDLCLIPVGLQYIRRQAKIITNV